MWRRLEPYLYSRRNIAGTVLGLGGLALFFTGVTGGAVWLPIVVGLYAIGVLVVPGERGLDLRLDAGADAAHVRDGLNQLLVSIRGRVADDIYARVSHIRDVDHPHAAGRPRGGGPDRPQPVPDPPDGPGLSATGAARRTWPFRGCTRSGAPWPAAAPRTTC